MFQRSFSFGVTRASFLFPCAAGFVISQIFRAVVSYTDVTASWAVSL